MNPFKPGRVRVRRHEFATHCWVIDECVGIHSKTGAALYITWPDLFSSQDEAWAAIEKLGPLVHGRKLDGPIVVSTDE